MSSRVFAAATVLLLVVLFSSCTKEKQPTTNSADADRIRAVDGLAQLACDFKDATGFYPLEDLYGNVPIMVYLTAGPLPDELRYPPPGMSGVAMPPNQFKAYLEDRLGRPVTIPLDDRPPISRPSGVLCCYQYLFDETDYFVSGVLESPNKMARALPDGHFKYEVGSVAVPESKIHRFECK
jgi:hypothetical protein